MATDAPELECRIEIAAEPAAVWELVHDVRRMADWSPQVVSTRLRSGFDEVRVGTEFTNRNALGDLVWTTHAEVISFTPGAEFAFRVVENWVIWSFHLEPTETGTRLTQRRIAPDGLSELSRDLTVGFLGGTKKFTETMRTGMQETLERIKATAESGSPA